MSLEKDTHLQRGKIDKKEDILRLVLGDNTPQEVTSQLQVFREASLLLDRKISDLRRENPGLTGWAAFLGRESEGDGFTYEIYPDLDALFVDLEARGIDRRFIPIQNINPPETLIL